MRLFTHNFLQCHVKGCTSDNFPLAISDAEVRTCESEFNESFMRAYLGKLDYPALLETVKSVRRMMTRDAVDVVLIDETDWRIAGAASGATRGAARGAGRGAAAQAPRRPLPGTNEQTDVVGWTCWADATFGGVEVRA